MIDPGDDNPVTIQIVTLHYGYNFNRGKFISEHHREYRYAVRGSIILMHRILLMLRISPTKSRIQLQFELNSNNRGIPDGDKRAKPRLPSPDHRKPLKFNSTTGIER